MDYIIVALLGMAGGAFCVFMLTEAQRKALHAQKREHEERVNKIQDSLEALRVNEERLEQERKRVHEELARENQNSFLAATARDQRYDQEVPQLKAAASRV